MDKGEGSPVCRFLVRALEAHAAGEAPEVGSHVPAAVGALGALATDGDVPEEARRWGAGALARLAQGGSAWRALVEALPAEQQQAIAGLL